jgi:DNA repair exonuclease SbcCD ATPase subunit
MKIAAWIGTGLLFLIVSPVLAQNGPPGGGGGGGGPGGPGGGPPDFSQMRQRMEEEMKQDMGVTDDQWKELQPKIEKVETLRRSIDGHGGPPGGHGPGDNDDQESPLEAATHDLEDVLDKDDPKADEIKEKVEAVRKARAAAKTELEKARKELAEGLNAREEAVLVARGMID